MATTSSEIEIDGRRVVVARPASGDPWPGVVMLHEAFGIDDVLRRQAERLAAAGYLVYAPDLLGAGAWLGCIRRTFRSLQAQQGRPFELIDTVRRSLAADPDCTGRTGVIGFCMGGGFALLVAARGFDAAAVNYGMIPPNADEVLQGACPVVASYGERDRLNAEVPRLRQALELHGTAHDVKTYPSAGHSFLNDAMVGPRLLRPLLKVAHVGPDPLAAADAWQRIEAFFGEHLTGSPIEPA